MRLVTLACATIAAAVLAGTAPAAPGLRVGIQDDAWLQFGPGTLEERVGRLDALGADLVRVTLEWRTIEATRGTYDWERADALLQALRQAGLTPLVSIWGTPGWANGGRAANVPPSSAATFATFARAAAERFPWVRRWIVWNEPNQRRWLSPPSPIVYVTRLLNPAATAIKAVIPRASIAGGATAPARRPRRHVAGRLHPRHGAGRCPARCVRAPSAPPLAGGDADVRRLCGAARPSRWRRSTAWSRRPATPSAAASASGSPSSASRPTRRTGSSASAGGRRPGTVAEAQHLAYRAAGVDVVIQYLLRDEPATDAWQSGLETVSGRAKPALAAFSLPFVQVVRRGLSTTVWGQVRPGTGARPYVLQRLVGDQWKAVGSGARTTTRGYVTRTLRADKGTRLRLYDPATKRASPALIVR